MIPAMGRDPSGMTLAEVNILGHGHHHGQRQRNTAKGEFT